MAVEAAAEVVQHRVVAEVVHHRAVRPPAEGLGQLQAVAVLRPQFDDADAVELREVLDALGLRQAVLGGELLQRPLRQHAQRAQQQLLVGHDGAFLLLGQLAEQRLGVGHPPRQFGEIDLEHAADRVDARQRHVALGQHPLDAGFGHAQALGQVRVRHLRGLQLFLQDRDEVGGGAHGGTGLRYPSANAVAM
jgi:hypothetical protein